MKILLVILVLIAAASAILCDEPQKTFYMSFQSLGKRDDINTMFQELNKNTSSFDSTYTDSTLNANFKIVGLKA